MKHSFPLVLFCVFSMSALSQPPDVTIGDVLRNPGAFAGKLVVLEGEIIRIVKGTGSYSYLELQDSSQDKIRVRTDLPSLVVGQIFRVQGRVRVEPLATGPYIMEEVMLFKGVRSAGIPAGTKPSAENAEPSSVPQAEDAPAEKTPTPPAAQPARKAVLPWLTQPRLASEKARENTPPSEAYPAEPTSENGMFGFCFRQAQGTLRDILITQLGRMFAMIVHPTCNFNNNQLTFAGIAGGGTLKASFVTTYSSLLMGEGRAAWELLFDSEGDISDIRFISDTSPFTNVGLINQVKGRIIGYILEQIRALRS